MWLDAIIAVVLALFATMGVLRGALAAGMSLLSIAVAYGAAVVAAPHVGPQLSNALGAPELAGLQQQVDTQPERGFGIKAVASLHARLRQLG